MKKTAFSLILLAGVGCVAFDAVANQGPVVSRTETTYSKQNEIIMDGYTALDPIDNSVKTDVRRYNNPQAAQQIAQAQAQAYAQAQIKAQAQAQAMRVQAQAVQPTQVAPANYVQMPAKAPQYQQHQVAGQIVIPQMAGQVLPQQAVQPRPVPAGVGCVAGNNCPAKISSIEYKQSPVKVQYPVVRQYPVSVEYPVTVNRDITVRQPVIVEQPVVVQRPVVVNQPVMVERAPAYIRQGAVRMQQQPSYVQQKEVVVQAPAGQVLPPCTTGNCR